MFSLNSFMIAVSPLLLLADPLGEWAIDQFFNQNGILAVLDLMKLCYTEKDIIQRSVELLYSISQIDKVLKKLEFSNLFEGLITILNVYKENPDIICNALATIYELCKLGMCVQHVSMMDRLDSFSFDEQFDSAEFLVGLLRLQGQECKQ